jgi:arylsulfatase A-like enzyme
MAPTNVLLITVDSIRADHVPLVHDDTPQTETFEELAADGVSFDQAFATGPATAYSFPGILTGTLSLSHGGAGPLEADRPRLSRWMQRAGLQTGGFHSNPFLSRHYNYDEGFDAFEDYQNPLMGLAIQLFPRGIEINDGVLGTVNEYVDVTGWIKSAYQLFKGKPRPYVGAEVITDDVLEWVSGREQRFFCWAHYMDVHHPCYPPAQYREEFDVAQVTQTEVSEWYSKLSRRPDELTAHELETLKKLYKASIAYVDDQVARLVEHLKSRGAYDDTLIIFTSDHGEMFGEHDLYGKPERMLDELLKVPLVVVNGPDHLQRAESELVSLLDVPGIICDALDVEIPPKYEGTLPGRGAPREHVIGEHSVDGDAVIGVRSKTHLYEVDEIRDARRTYAVGDGTAVRLPDEETPASLERVASERLSELNRDSQLVARDLDDDVESRLEDLGYT